MITNGEFFMIHTLKSQGLSVSEIARQLKVDRKTVRKYLGFNADDPSAMQRKPRTRKLAVYEPYLLERVHQFPTLTATRLMRETKFDKTRLVPLGPHLARVMKDYATQRKASNASQADEAPFFVNRDGPPCCKNR